MEGCFIERCVALDGAKLSRFPAIFFRIKRRVERKCVDVVMRIGDAVDGPCFGVNKARVDQVSRCPLLIAWLAVFSFSAYPGLHTVLDVDHRFLKRFMDQSLDRPIPGFDKVQRHRLWYREIEIIACSTIRHFSVLQFPGVCFLLEDHFLLPASRLHSHSQRFVRSWSFIRCYRYKILTADITS